MTFGCLETHSSFSRQENDHTQTTLATPHQAIEGRRARLVAMVQSMWHHCCTILHLLTCHVSNIPHNDRSLQQRHTSISKCAGAMLKMPLLIHLGLKWTHTWLLTTHVPNGVRQHSPSSTIKSVCCQSKERFKGIQSLADCGRSTSMPS